MKTTKNWDDPPSICLGMIIQLPQKKSCKSSNKGRGGSVSLPKWIFFFLNIWEIPRISDGWTFLGRINLWVVLGDRIFHISPSMIDPKAVVVGSRYHRYIEGPPECRGDWQNCQFWCLVTKLVSMKDRADARGAKDIQSGSASRSWQSEWTNLASWIQGLL